LEEYNDNFYGKNCPHKGSQDSGAMIKATGYWCDGPIGPSGFFMNPVCGYSSLERYSLTWRQETEESWFDSAPALYNLTSAIDGPGTIQWSNLNISKQWFYDNWDVNLSLSYLALVDWAGTADDLGGNFMLYYRYTDKKFVLAPWDMDDFLGLADPCTSPTCTLYFGEQGGPTPPGEEGDFNPIKDAFFKTFRPELQHRWAQLSNTILKANHTVGIMNAAYAKVNLTSIRQSPAGKVPFCMSSMQQWQVGREQYVTGLFGVSNETVDVCPDVPNIVVTHTNWSSKPGRPNAPRMVTRTAQSLSLTWSSPNPNGSPITSYTLERQQGQTFINVYQGPSNSFVDTTVSPRSYYVYRVSAENDLGKGSYSNTVTLQTGVGATSTGTSRSTSPSTSSTSPSTSPTSTSNTDSSSDQTDTTNTQSSQTQPSGTHSSQTTQNSHTSTQSSATSSQTTDLVSEVSNRGSTLSTFMHLIGTFAVLVIVAAFL